MFEAILFDFDGTLVDFIEADIQSLRCLHSQASSTVCFDSFLETSVDEIMRFHVLVDKGKIDPLVMHEFRLKNTFIKHKMVWNGNYVDFYKTELLRTCTPFEGVEKLLSEIKQKVKTGLITNAYDGKEQRERIRSSGLEAYFDLIVIAGEIGIYKPDPAIFLHLLNHIHVVPNKSLYIGDSIAHDISGARSAGMKTALFSQYSSRDSNLADYVIKGMDELHNLLNRVVA